jgi:hypothetical protein
MCTCDRKFKPTHSAWLAAFRFLMKGEDMMSMYTFDGQQAPGPRLCILP